MNLASSQDEQLVQHLREVHRSADTTSFKVLDFASAFGSPLEALVYSKLFWPDFTELDGIIIPSAALESEQDRARVQHALSQDLSRQEIERSLNRFEIPSDFFASHRLPTSDEENLELAERMAQSWRARLSQLCFQIDRSAWRWSRTQTSRRPWFSFSASVDPKPQLRWNQARDNACPRTPTRS